MLAPSELRGKLFPLDYYISHYPDSTTIQVEDPIEVPERLRSLQGSSLALDFSLILLDSTVREATCRKVALELNDLLEDESHRNYVLSVLLACPLPDDVDLRRIREATSNYERAGELFETLASAQPRVRLLHAAWLSLRSDPLTKQAGPDSVLGQLLRFGVFRQLVTRGSTQSEVADLKGELVLSLKDCINPRILSAFISTYSSSLPKGSESLSPRRNLYTVDEDSPVLKVRTDNDRPHSRNYHSTQQLVQAQTQVEKIASLYGKGNDSTAQGFLAELISSQTSHTHDHSHVVKSLCNIATKCRIRGRRDASLSCLEKALEFKSGIDAVLYLQIGNALRDLREFDRAIDCYKIAEKLATSTDRLEKIRIEIIRVTAARGDYEEAAAQYRQLPHLDIQPEGIFGLATVCRKMGDLRQARTSYHKVLNLEDTYHAAIAGLAEVSKQTGHHHKALARYNLLMRRFPDMEESSNKVYTLSRAYLFRVTRQLTKAACLLEELHDQYPMDSDVQFQLAKQYLLQGDTSLAKTHFDKARSKSLDHIAERLYLAAMGKSADTASSINADVDDYSSTLPENRGLWTCSHAMNAILKGDYFSAKSILAEGRYVDRLHADFGTVLGYHALLKLDSHFNYKARPEICRIAKRGYPELRQTVQAITDRNFEKAERIERRMCLIVAE